MLKLYQQLLFHHEVKEEKNVYHSLTERHLHVLWVDQQFLKKLVTGQGEEIQVVSPGFWNMEAGPDFLKAHLRIGQKDYRGDVEIHVHEEGWYQHGHHRDPRYNQVVLHLSFWRSSRPLTINKENGQQAFTSYLNESLKVSIDRFLLSIDFDHYPSKQFSKSGRCAKDLFSLLPEKQVQNFFQSAAYWRLEKKLNFLEQARPDRPLQFVGGIAMALGYKHNAKIFLDLFLYLMEQRDLPFEELMAIAFGCCGFLEEKRKKEWEQSEYYLHLRRLWWGKKDRVIHQAHLKLDHIRPLHHPLRRLAYLVHLLQDANLEQLWPATFRVWEKAIEVPVPEYKKLTNKLFQILPLYADPYWDYHYTFESQARPTCLPSLGKDLKMHLLLNTTLPLLYATIKESRDFQMWEKFQQFYASLEISQNSQSHYLHHRFFGERKEKKLLNQAQMTQGAYQLHQDFCLHFEASCEGCPFVERYQAQRK
jgi:hypothetical protein